MEHIDFVIIDWDATRERLKQLRLYNLNLHRYVCHELRITKDEVKCNGKNCENCVVDDRKNNFTNKEISQPELAEVMGVTANQIANWESKRSIPNLENLFFYCRLCKIEKIEDLIVFER